MVIDAPLIARKAHAGNFVILRIDEKGERIPLTIADYNREAGTITLVVQVVGKTTKQLHSLNAGDTILDFAGPLGNAIEAKKYSDTIVVVGGGVGIAPCYPQVKELKSEGNQIISIIGSRTSDLLFWREKMAEYSDELIICTDDGSEGIQGFVTDPLKEILLRERVSLVIAIGPLIMMKNVTLLTAGNEELEIPHVKTMVSLNPIMVDGTGMCGGCRYRTFAGESHFSCVEGPDVDGHTVDFDNLIQRNKRHRTQEMQAMDHYEHACKILKMGEVAE
jgi:ferredoxin--NADP+ reductase